jgi:hypothetical protein
MGKKLLLAAFGLVLAALTASPAAAQATRTWVSGVGDDANPCSRTAACKTFAGAISKTAPGGEINCIDPGGFGAVTITKAITIDCTNTRAGVLVSGTNGIVVNAGPNDTVVLRGLDINGLGTGANGVALVAGGQLSIDKCVIYGFSTAVSASISTTSELYITDTYITKGTTGIFLSETAALPNNLFAVINNVQIFNMFNNAILTGTNGGSLVAAVSNSQIVSVGGAAFNIFTGGARFFVDTTMIQSNNVAFDVQASNVGIRISNNTIYLNGANFPIAGGVTGSTVFSSGNNRVTKDATSPGGAVDQQ